MLIVQLHAKHGVGQRLDHCSHNLDCISLGIYTHRRTQPTICFSVFSRSTGQSRVRTSGPLRVTATMCSKCAELAPSAVTAVQ